MGDPSSVPGVVQAPGAGHTEGVFTPIHLVVRRASLLAVAVLAGAHGAACLELNRADGLADGTLTVPVLDSSGEPVDGARVQGLLAPRQATSGDGGNAVLTRLTAGGYVVRAEVVDNNNAVTAIGYAVGQLRVDSSKSGDVAVGALASPAVVVEPGRLAGSVAGCDATVLCRVAISHAVTGTIVDGIGTIDITYAGGIEQTAAVGTDGTFDIDGVGGGEVQLLALRWDRPLATAPLQQLIAASNPTGFGRSTVTLEAGGAITDLTLDTNTDATDATVEASFDVVAPTLAGLEGSMDPVVPTTTTTIGDARPSFAGLQDGNGAFKVQIPVGVFDLNIQFEGAVNPLPANVILQSYAAPTDGITPVATGLDTRCFAVDAAEDASLDCDDDGKINTEDDDIDGDGVLDADEPTACIGVGRGVDLDGDCLCEPFDPVPDCQSNDPLECTPAVVPSCPKGLRP